MLAPAETCAGDEGPGRAERRGALAGASGPFEPTKGYVAAAYPVMFGEQ